MTSRRALLALALLPLAAACSRKPATVRTTLAPRSLAELHGYLLAHKPDLDQFRARGPFSVAIRENHELRLSAAEPVNSDLFLSAPTEKAPLVVLVHGHDSVKEDHTYQAIHLASWGLHSLAVQLAGDGPWVGNGRMLKRIVNAIRGQPGLVDERIDADRIVLAGHSFGGSAVCIALGDGAQAAGGVLLDPAGIGAELPRYLGRIRKPVMVLGADVEIFEARDRDYFYQFIRSGVAEVSVRDADHEDAQYPATIYGLDLLTTEALQITFVSALTASAFSIAVTGNLDYAWASFSEAIGDGKFIHAKRKGRRPPGQGAPAAARAPRPLGSS